MMSRVRDAVAPYTRYVRAEKERLETLEARFAELQGRASAVRRRVEGLA
jgi:hypothetical protein